MKTLIFLGGDLGAPHQVSRYLHSATTIIAVDHGADHCYRLGLTPDLLLGDLDSIAPATLAHYQALGVEIERHPRHKDATDLELALDRVAGERHDGVLLLAALGGRWDMSLGNVLTAARPAYRKLRLALIGSDCTLHILHPGRSLLLTGAVGERVSLLPVHGDARGITLEGFEYPLQNATLNTGSSRGISNVMLAPEASVSLTLGTLVCVHLHERCP
jgi:thiamine pyrophosphokinase